MAKQIPGTRVLDQTFKQTVTAVAVPPIAGLQDIWPRVSML